ncbi:MAG: nitrile hydratase subunit beta [Gammaproteobacteria bacterium]|nr:nitrile hydratase subunit beta [Gammaproteobacteria bacterium]MDE0441475.1 nitrile hydratase subunit beta [Gammaproteobacteria bacterium]
MPSAHDRGGVRTREPIDQTSHEWADWEHLVNAMVGVLRRHGLINVDELRRGIEAMTPVEYESSSYYERWSASIEHILVEKGVLSTEEITAATREIDARWG